MDQNHQAEGFFAATTSGSAQPVFVYCLCLIDCALWARAALDEFMARKRTHVFVAYVFELSSGQLPLQMHSHTIDSVQQQVIYICQLCCRAPVCSHLVKQMHSM